MGPEETGAPVSVNAAQCAHEDAPRVLRSLWLISVDAPHVLLRPPQHRQALVSAGGRGLLGMRTPWAGLGLGRPLRAAQAMQEAL